MTSSPESATSHWMGRPNANSPAPQRIDLRNGIAATSDARTLGEELGRGPARLAAGAREVLALGPLDAAQIGDGAAELLRERLGGLRGRAVLEGRLDRRAGDLLLEVRLARGDAGHQQREPARGAQRAHRAVAEPELGEALRRRDRERAERGLDKRRGAPRRRFRAGDRSLRWTWDRGRYPRTARSARRSSDRAALFAPGCRAGRAVRVARHVAAVARRAPPACAPGDLTSAWLSAPVPRAGARASTFLKALASPPFGLSLRP